MTPLVLLDRLSEFTASVTKDILLPTKPTPKTKSLLRAPEIWKMRLPDAESETQKLPYILIQVLNILDQDDEEQREDSLCNVRFVLGAYNENNSEGALSVLTMMVRLRQELLRQRVIGDQFTLRKPIECAMYEGDTAPLFFGEMSTNWELPIMRREVPALWQGQDVLLHPYQITAENEILPPKLR